MDKKTQLSGEDATFDRISRQAAIDTAEWAYKACEGNLSYYHDLLVAALMDLTPAQSGWISCKERLPEAYTDVLVWFEYFRYGDYNRLYQMYGIGNYCAEYDSWMINYETGWRKLRVLAWVPLPAEYREGGEK